MKSSRWYLAANGNGYGPFTFQQLKQLAQTEMIGPSDFAWQEGNTEARHVRDIAGLLHDQRAIVRKHTRLVFGMLFVLVAVGSVSSWAAWENLRNSEDASAVPVVVGDVDADTPAIKDPEEMVETNDAPQPKASSKTERRESLAQNRQVPISSNSKPSEKRQFSLRESVPRGRVVIGNVALATKGASATGPYKGGEFLLDGDGRKYSGYAKINLHKPIVVTLADTYQVRRIRIHLIAAWLPNNSKESFYRYKVEVSADGSSFDTVADRTNGRHRDWQDLRFAPHPVKTIRITGTHDHPHQTGIRIVEVEAYCTEDN